MRTGTTTGRERPRPRAPTPPVRTPADPLPRPPRTGTGVHPTAGRPSPPRYDGPSPGTPPDRNRDRARRPGGPYDEVACRLLPAGAAHQPGQHGQGDRQGEVPETPGRREEERHAQADGKPVGGRHESCGGRTRRDTATASPPANSSATAAYQPVGPRSASNRPGSGLAAGVSHGPRPVGNANTCCTRGPGDNSALGRTSRTRPPTATAAPRTAPRIPPWWASSVTATATAGHAVHLREQAAASASPAATGRCRAAYARARNSSPVSGRSTPLTQSGSATTGEATNAPTAYRLIVLPTAADGPPAWRRVARRAAHRQPKNAAAHQSRASPSSLSSGPLSPSAARGNPNTAMPGRYGVTSTTVRGSARYGVA
ncbi:hypothetical protein QFZ82_002287 [Streptomyces sp. V4I23]|nr:hypothetical protein [Streptomyces sp. V4I23]